MAIQMAISTEYGIDVTAAYIRIGVQSGNKEEIRLYVHIYSSGQSAHNGKEWMSEKLFSFVPDVADNASNFIKQGYEYLKTLPEFSSAVDV